MQTDAVPASRAWLAPLIAGLSLLIGVSGSAAIAWQLARFGSVQPAVPVAAREAPALRASAATAEARARLLGLRDTLSTLSSVDERQYAALADPVLGAEPALLALLWLTADPTPPGATEPQPIRVRHALYGTRAATLGLPSRSELLGRDLGSEAGLTVLQTGQDSSSLHDFGFGPGQASRLYRATLGDGSTGYLLALFHLPGIAERLLAAASGPDYALRLERDELSLAADPDAGEAQAAHREVITWYSGALTLAMWPRQPPASSSVPPALPWAIGIGGSLLSAALAWLWWRMLSRSARMQQLMQRRTAELVEAYDRARDSELMAMQAEKLSALGQMVAGVAHEINTPLGYISSNLQLLHEKLATLSTLLERDRKLLDSGLSLPKLSPEQRLQWWHLAKAQSDAHVRLADEGGIADLDAVTIESLEGLARLADLVQTLKNFARVDRAPVDHVQLNDCIRDTLKIAHNVLKHRAEVELDLGELPELRVNPSQINQVLLNLVTNAAQAIEGYGKVRIQSRASEEGITISVEDNGSGIPAAHLHRIFEPFFSTKPQGEGTGLGLPIARKIIAEHGGDIEVHSTVGEGTRFLVRLPLLPAH